MENNIIVSPYGKIKVEWLDKPENYSKDNKNKIRNYFSRKYNVSKNNIIVDYKAIKHSDNGDLIEITGSNIENIMDVNYQRALMKEVIDRDKKNVDFNRIIALDDKVNSELNIDLSQTQHKSWSLKWIMIDNFLSFGKNNYLPFSKVRGFTIVNSSPGNFSGKTTLTIDSIKFLLHGSTTKTDKNEQIFNTFTKENDLLVRGMIEIEGDEIIIERKMKRTAKKEGGWTITNKVNYYKILPDGTEESLNDEDAKKTTIRIRETIGSERDFEMLVLATEKNLEDLISLTTSESGKTLTRLIGLEVLEFKETIVRKMYNEFASKKKSNNFDIVSLKTDIDEHNEKITTSLELEKILKDKLAETKNKILELENENDHLFNSKQKIDVSIASLNPSALEKEIETHTINGKNIKNEISEINKELINIGDVSFNEDLHHSLTKELNKNELDKSIKESEVNRLKMAINDLISGGICQTCNRKLDDVDNTEHIAKHNVDINILTNDLSSLKDKISSIQNTLFELNKTKETIDNKNKLELKRDRLEVEIDSLRNKLTNKMDDLKKYKSNLNVIEHNKDLDIKITKVKTDIIVYTRTKDDILSKIERISMDIQKNKDDIIEKTKLIETIKREDEVEKIFKVYIDLVGKKGISKLVLRSALPIINSELQRLLDDVCEFEVEVMIDDKNDVQFLLVNGETSKQLKSGSGFEKTSASLALRAVLGKISTLPMPNFITFDEVLGKVAQENLGNMKILFDRIKDMYEIVFLITHNDVVKEWATNILTVVKEDNISRFTLS
jgi:DNA repair exonuclease SbcCD ATPase subunit